jgi:hypothetical protein
MAALQLSSEQILVIVLFLAGTFLTWLITYIYFKKSERTRQICFSWTRDRLFSFGRPRFGELELSIDGERTIDPYRLELFVWNPGSETINGFDISKQDPLKFGSPNIRIIKVERTIATRQSVNFKYTLDGEKKFINLDFDFLDENDGFAIEILYDQSGEVWPNLAGTIKGIKGAPLFASFRSRPAGLFNRYVSGPSFTIFMLACAALTFYDVWIAGLFSFTSIAKVLAGIICTIIGAITTFISFEQLSTESQLAVPGSLITKGDDELRQNDFDRLRNEQLSIEHRIKRLERK